MLPDYKDFAEYIALNYPRAKKIIEVGAGRERSVIRELRALLRGAEIIAVDIEEWGVVLDDITAPRRELYRGVDLIYSIRPNPELYQYLIKIAEEAKADLIIRPFSLDQHPEKGRLVNYKTSSFYVL